MTKSFFREIGVLILINGIVYLIYSNAFGDAFHYTIPEAQAFRDRNAKIIGSFLFFYPALAYSMVIVYFIRALKFKFKSRSVNFILFSMNVITIGFPMLALYYDYGLKHLIQTNAPLYDSLLLPINLTQYSMLPLFITLFYSAHHIPLAFEPEYIPETESQKNYRNYKEFCANELLIVTHYDNVFIDEFRDGEKLYLDPMESPFESEVYNDFLIWYSNLKTAQKELFNSEITWPEEENFFPLLMSDTIEETNPTEIIQENEKEKEQIEIVYHVEENVNEKDDEKENF